MKKRSSAIALTLLTATAAAEVPPDYQAKIGRWKIEGRFFGDGISCGATVETKIGTFNISRTLIGDSWKSMLAAEGGVVIIPDSQADKILESQYIYKNGKIVAETGGSWEVLQEFNRCWEAGFIGQGGEREDGEITD